MLKYAGGAVCPRCRASLVHEYDCSGDCLPFDALTQVEQRLICPVCSYTRHVAYLIERQKRAAHR